MSLPLVFQTGVRDEIDEAYAWYEKQRTGLGEDFLSAVQAVLERIERNPEVTVQSGDGIGFALPDDSTLALVRPRSKLLRHGF
jgi:hypothetical protein